MPSATKKKVGIIFGGPSLEHEASLKSGEAVLRHIDKEKYDPLAIFISKEGTWQFEDSPEMLESDALEELKHRNVAVIFNALHGKYGEDGTLQSLLDTIGIPYTGSRATPSALNTNKAGFKKLFASQNIQTPRFLAIMRGTYSPSQIEQKLKEENINFPLIIKSLSSNSGALLVPDASSLKEATETMFEKYPSLVIEECIEGKAISVSVLDHKDIGAQALPPTHIIHTSKQNITPANLMHEAIREAQEMALQTHAAIGASGISQTNMIIDKDGEVHVVSFTTHPKLAEASLLPQQAQAAGISFGELITTMIGHTLKTNFS